MRSTNNNGLVSIPFIAGQWSLLGVAPAASGAGATCLNPLHCGAVVASVMDPKGQEYRALSLNPLHCGAVVASAAIQTTSIMRPPVSIPFIAGQWSLRGRRRRGARGGLSQSPSLRGSGRFGAACRRRPAAAQRLNPLHCGAVVASRDSEARLLEDMKVSIPFIAGQWSLLVAGIGQALTASRVSIPFIAGQWSLRSRSAGAAGGRGMSQSPSLRGSGRFPRRSRGSSSG